MIVCTATPNGSEIQINCLATRSVIVVFGGWINGFDGCCRLEQRNWLKTRDCSEPQGAEKMCDSHVRILGFVLEGGAGEKCV